MVDRPNINLDPNDYERPPALLDREEYIEQAYFFRVYRERVEEAVPSQEILSVVEDEILATTNLPKAIDFLKGEILLTGELAPGMSRLSHYFTPFQTYMIAKAEDERSRLDYRIALLILEREATYRAANPTMPGMFVYHFECIARNRLGYDGGMLAVADDPIYDETWQKWVRWLRLQLGTHDLAEFIYAYSQQYVDDQLNNPAKPNDAGENVTVLFGAKEGRIARANRGKDPLYMFAALQRQLGYPAVPRSARKTDGPAIHPALEQRIHRLEQRIKLLENEAKGSLDLNDFFENPPALGDDPAEI